MVMPDVLQAALWALLGSSALLIGALVAVLVALPERVVGMLLGFAAGVLISTVSADLATEAIEEGGPITLAVGLAAGSVVFFVGAWLIDQAGGGDRLCTTAEREDRKASTLVFGSVLDGVPEALAIGISLLAGGMVGLSLVAAVFLSNLPESMAATTSMRKAKHSIPYIFGSWTVVVLTGSVASAAGYVVVGVVLPDAIGLIHAFAAGALLTMVAHTVLPEAFEHGGRATSLLATLGFAAAFILSAVSTS
jgi:ZIP family zinc transporter